MIAAEIKGDILSSRMQTLVCPVNRVAVMGNGLALYFRNNFPGLFDAYCEACRSDVFFNQTGLFMFEYTPTWKVLCMATKDSWKAPSSIRMIDGVLEALAANYEHMGITSLAIPAVGCGKGLLDWKAVQPLIHHHLGRIPLKVEIYLP